VQRAAARSYEPIYLISLWSASSRLTTSLSQLHHVCIQVSD
jgi:hypothetical protein